MKASFLKSLTKAALLFTLEVCSSCLLRLESDDCLVGNSDRNSCGNPDAGRTFVARVEDVDEAAVVEAELGARGRVGRGGRV